MWVKAGLPHVTCCHNVVGHFVTPTKIRNDFDPYFMEFLRERYNDPKSRYFNGKNVEDFHNVWRFGYPSNLSVLKNLVRYRFPITDPEDDIWIRAQTWTKRTFNFMSNSKIDWSFDYVKEYVNPSKSPGFPYSRKYMDKPNFSTKRDFLKYMDGSYAKTQYEAYLERISDENYVPSCWYVASGKKELRKVKKIKSDDFRAYLAANNDNTLAGIAATVHMNDKFYRSWRSSPAFVGGTLFGGGWNVLFQRLGKHFNAFEMDVSAWDATLSEYMIESLCDIMWSFVRAEDRTRVNCVRFKNLFKEIAQSVVLCPNGDVFLKNQGNPSGSFLTIITNTIIHYCLFCYAFIKLHPLKTYDDFVKNVELALCGDDSLGTVSDQFFETFNPRTIIPVWLKLGVKAKEEAVGEGPLVQRHFLSQHTRLIFGLYMPYPEYDKVVSSMLWKTKAQRHIRWSYLKACAMRIYSFNNPDLQIMLADYIAFLVGRDDYKFMLQSPCAKTKEDPLSWEQVHSVYKDDFEIWRLYTVPEADRSAQITIEAGLESFLDVWSEEGQEGFEEGPQSSESC